MILPGMYNGEESMQTRLQDDLFDDDFVPISEDDTINQPAPEPTPELPPFDPKHVNLRGGYGNQRGRGRGRGRGFDNGYNARGTRQHPTPFQSDTRQDSALPNRTTSSSLLESRHAPKPPILTVQAIEPESTQSNNNTTPESNIQLPSDPSKATDKSNDSTAVIDPTAPSTTADTTSAKATKTSAVRGDRTLTGGTQRAKLTEEELTARMEAVKLKNASREEAYAREQADAEAFATRETEAENKRKEERQDRQIMMGERERNRQRKLKAQGVREWDEGKDDSGGADRAKRVVAGPGMRTLDGRNGDNMRPDDDGREYMYREDRGQGNNNKGKPAARENVRSNNESRKGPVNRAPNSLQQEDFPALVVNKSDTSNTQQKQDLLSAPLVNFPGHEKKTKDNENITKPAEYVLSPLDAPGRKSWADRMEE